VDRPFAGYLYGKAQQSRFLINENIIQYGLTLGIIGPSSMAENVQTSYHHFLKIHHLEGWNTQLNNSPCINFNFDYVLHLIAKSPRRVADLAAVGKLNVGTSFDNFSAGLIARLGKFERNDRSVTWDSRLDKAKRLYEKKSELYFYFQPQMTYQVYNATLQGGMFLDNKGPVTASPTPWVFEARFGFRYAKNHISMGASFVHETREARSMMANDDYGSLLLSYRFN
jgi:hypothetical protein